jgi:hypothetical protein
MKLISLFTFIILFFVGCKGSDFKLSSPKASTNGVTNVNFNHNLFLSNNCAQCHEKKRPISTPPHGKGADCISCHSASLNIVGVRTWQNIINFTHNPPPSTCINCHANKRPTTAPHSFNQWGEKEDCASCHTHPTWTQAKFVHKGKPLTSCVQCHLQASDDRIPGPLASLHPTKFYESKISYFEDLKNGNTSNLTTLQNVSISPMPLLPTQSTFLNKLLNTNMILQADPIQMDCIVCHNNIDDNRKWYGTTENTDPRPTSMTFNYNTHKNRPSDTDPTSCNSCHEVQRPSNHFTTPLKVLGIDKGDCVSCHQYSKNAIGFGVAVKTDWRDLLHAINHEADKPQTCIGCHTNSVPTSQLPTATAHSTHPVAQGTYYKIDCVKCHTYTNRNAVTQKWSGTGLLFNQNTHLKIDGTSPTACVQCHKIDNNSLPNPLINASHTTGSRANNDCAVCHKFDQAKPWSNYSVFKHTVLGATERCDSCHNSSFKTLTSKTLTHAVTTLDCKSCHNTTSWKSATFTHSTSDTNCMSCHNGTTATGKTTTHVKTIAQCSTCHTNAAWKPATFKHAATDTDCMSCHNGTTAKTKPATHVATTAQCSTCHTNTAWKPATFKHAATDTNCSSCHNGTTAKTKPATHVATTAQCSTCHTNTAWKPATFKHAATDTNCKNCHNGTTAKARSTTHNLPIANLQCSTCHNQTSWQTLAFNTSYKHSSAGGLLPKGTTYHKSQATCTMCHSSTSDNVNFFDKATNTIYSPKCLGCHTTDFNNKHGTGYSSKANCLSCHSYGGW